MNQKEAILLLGVVGAAIVAALSFHVAALPAELHDPAAAQAFTEAADVLPILRAVRVRVPGPPPSGDLAARLRGAGRVVDPSRAQRAFRHGRLLYGTPDEVRAVRDALRAKRRPASLPTVPDVRRFFRDPGGPYLCDVVLNAPEEKSLARIRDVFPKAELSGEPVRKEAEWVAMHNLPRALLLAVVVAYLWCRVRGRAAERRLLAAVLPLAISGALGWGIDVWMVPAIAIAAAAPRGPILLAGVFGLFFPSLSLQRMGLVFLTAGLVRWQRRAPPEDGDRTLATRLMGVLALAAVLAVAVLPAASPAPREEAAAFVPLDEIASPVPDDADRPMRLMLSEIYRRAAVLGFDDVRDAAAVDSLYWPQDLRARLRTTDGRGVRWVAEPDLDRDELMSAELYRLRGARDLRHHARVVALLMFLVCGVVLVVQRASPAALLVRSGAIVAGLFFCPAAALPLLVMAAFTPSPAVVLAVGAAAAAMPAALLWPGVAIGLASGCAWLTRRRPRPLPVPPAETGPDLPGR